MSFSAKAFLKTYGTVGISVYFGVSAVSIGSIYLVLRSGGADSWITAPLERLLGSDSEAVQKIKQQLGEANQRQQQPAIGSHQEGSNESHRNNSTDINFVREGTYLGIASLVDSFTLPVKLAVCLPIAKAIIKRRR